jgi:RNA recognition motif. (a.k.a. RRM, RBD, or RNP domain)
MHNDPKAISATPRVTADPRRPDLYHQDSTYYQNKRDYGQNITYMQDNQQKPYVHESTPIGETSVGQRFGSCFEHWSAHNTHLKDSLLPVSSEKDSIAKPSTELVKSALRNELRKGSDYGSYQQLKSAAGQSNSHSMSSGGGKPSPILTGSKMNSVRGLYGDSANLRDSEVSEDSNYSSSGYPISIGRRGRASGSANDHAQQNPVTIVPRRNWTSTSLSTNQNITKYAIETNLLQKVHTNHAESNLRFQPSNPIWRDQETGRVRSQSVHTNSEISSDGHSLAGLPRDDLKGKKKPSHVVYVKGVDFERVSLSRLVNLCQCFGRVDVAMAHLSKEYSLIKFHSIQDAKYCIKELYGKTIGSKSLLLHYSGFDEIKTKGNSSEKIYHTPENLPLEQEKSLVVGHIAKTLLFTIHSKDSILITFDHLRMLFERELGNCRSHAGVLPNQIFVEFPTLKGAISFALAHNRSYLYNGNVQLLLNFSSRYKFF